jgi:steroid delta-isomerase-like uncharacterized protein
MPRVLTTILTILIAIPASFGFMPGHLTAQPATPASASDRAENEAVVRRFFEIASGGNLDDFAAIVSPEFVIRTAPPGEGSSLETLTQTFEAVRIGLPDFTIRIDDLFAEGDMVVTRTTISGTHLGDFFGAPATGQPIATTAIDLWRIEDGLLAENWHLEDILAVMEQIAAAAGAEGLGTPSAIHHDATPLTAAGDTDDAPVDSATVAANKAFAQRFHDEIFAQGNFAVADEILNPDFVWHSEVPPGVAGVKTFASTVRTAFPDLTLTADQVIAEGDRVAILWTLTGTHQGEFLGVPATGNTVSTPGIDIYRIENGQIAEIWTVGDELGLLMQLGSFPEFWADPPGTPSNQ